MTVLLELKALDKRFGGLHVTRDVSFALHAGDRLALIGPNGAGKTTLVNLISGVLAPRHGRSGSRRDVTRLAKPQRVRARPRPHLPDHDAGAALPVQRQIELALRTRRLGPAAVRRSVDASAEGGGADPDALRLGPTGQRRPATSPMASNA